MFRNIYAQERGKNHKAKGDCSNPKKSKKKMATGEKKKKKKKIKKKKRVKKECLVL